MRHGAAFALALGAAACGARSALVDASPLSGAGGHGGTTSSDVTSSTSATSTTSVGGGVPGCALVLSGPPIGFKSLWLANPAFAPKLTPLGGGGSVVAMVYRWDTGAEGTLANLAHVELTPWQAWPTAFAGQPFAIVDTVSDAFAVAPGPAANVAILVGQYNKNATLLSVSTGTSGSDATLLSIEGSYAEPLTPAFLAAGPSDYAVGAQKSSSGQFSISVRRTGPVAPPADPVACATAPLVAAGVERGDDYLIATSNGRAFGACLDPNGTDGPPSRLHVARIAGSTIQLGAEKDGDAPLVAIEIARRQDGAWIASQRHGSPSAAPVRAFRIDGAAALASGELDAVPEGHAALGFDACALGDSLAIAWIETGGAEPTLFLRAFDASSDAPAAETTVALGNGVSGRVGLLASPAGDRLIAAWDEQPGGGLATNRVARFDFACAH